jgi:hypothetical protein
VGQVQGIYSDLLLHRMGTDLNDPGSGYGLGGFRRPSGPGPGEWRTPPLWGFRDSAPYLHDGRARNLEEAVACHGGQASASARAFFALPAPDQAKVEAFLNSMVAPTRAGMPWGELSEQESVTGAGSGAEVAAEAECLIRDRRQAAIDREERQAQAARRLKLDKVRLGQVGVKLPIAHKLETLGKTQGALDFYQQIVRIAPDSHEARLAADRIVAITATSESP